MYVGASEFRPKSSRSKNSKPRTSFFGARRRSAVEADASSKESLPLPPTSPRRTLSEKPSMGSLSSGSRRRLRKAGSKTSLAASFQSQGSDESRPVSRVDQLLGRGLGAQGTIASCKLTFPLVVFMPANDWSPSTITRCLNQPTFQLHSSLPCRPTRRQCHPGRCQRGWKRMEPSVGPGVTYAAIDCKGLDVLATLPR